jgi:hypothetical protein
MLVSISLCYLFFPNLVGKLLLTHSSESLRTLFFWWARPLSLPLFPYFVPFL